MTSFAEIQSGASRIMLCGDTVHFAGGTPAFFGCIPDRPSSSRAISLCISNLSRESGPRLPGPGRQLKADALWEGYVFDLENLDREVSLMESRGVPIELRHKIECLGDVVLKHDALRLCAHTAVQQLLGASIDISAAYWQLIPDECRHDRSKLIPLGTCRKILTDAPQRHWPMKYGKRNLELALESAGDVLARIELNATACLDPEDEEALASMAVDSFR